MKKIALRLMPVLVALGVFFVPASVEAVNLQTDLSVPLLQQGDEYLFTADTTTGGEEASALLGLMFMCFWCGISIFALATTVIWVLSLIDIVQRDNWKNENDKIIWLLLVIFLNIASLYYYFFYRKQLDREVTSTSVEPTANPQK